MKTLKKRGGGGACNSKRWEDVTKKTFLNRQNHLELPQDDSSYLSLSLAVRLYAHKDSGTKTGEKFTPTPPPPPQQKTLI